MEQRSSQPGIGDSDFIKFVERSKIYLNAIKKKALWILIAMLIVSGINLYLALEKGKFYQCKLTFILDEDQSGGGLDIAALTGFYALKNENQLGTSSSRIMKLFQSNKFLANELLKADTLNNTNLANRVLEHYDAALFFGQLSLIDNWDSEELKHIENYKKEFKFTNSKFEELNRVEKAILFNIIDFLTHKKDAVTKISFDENSGLFTLLTQSKSHDLSIDLTNGLFNALSKFYTSNRSLKYSEIYEINKTKADSLQNSLATLEYRLADIMDSNRQLVMFKSQLKKNKLQTELQVLQVLYSEARKQLQISEYALRQTKPIFQIIDQPSESLIAIKRSKRRAVLNGCILGATGSIFLIVLFKAFNLALRRKEY